MTKAHWRCDKCGYVGNRGPVHSVCPEEAYPSTIGAPSSAAKDCGCKWEESDEPGIYNVTICGKHFPKFSAPKAPSLNDGELWSFLRGVMAKGSDLGQQFRHGSLSYEHHSAHLDAEAANYAKQLRAKFSRQLRGLLLGTDPLQGTEPVTSTDERNK